MIVTGGSLLILIIVTLFAGYALSRFPFPGNKVLLVGLFFLLAMLYMPWLFQFIILWI
ncbi:hypothetical protein JCM9140_4262 [Halalkalibacter wakoensis JCM 9140]|uniref:Uncharacterized protein n=1 Tax=Halalkalibacter wakoensis JCM 9140 TaxID=1236970 RepID=W4Q7V0_9BACI|nr:hypothetical protein JCM9140_4262 [Halalkalibacter wakoensis JCM 9140]